MTKHMTAYVIATLSGVVTVATLIVFYLLVADRGLAWTVEQIAFFIRSSVSRPMILIPLILFAGIPGIALVVRGGDVGAAWSNRLLSLAIVLLGLSALLAIIGVWNIAFTTPRSPKGRDSLNIVKPHPISTNMPLGFVQHGP